MQARFVTAGSILLAAIALPSSAQSRSRIDVPVMIGGEVNIPACYGAGTIKGLDPNGDGFLSIMSGPGGRPFHEMDRVYNGQRVALCDERGLWFAVVYAPGKSLEACGVNEGIAIKVPYTGPCRFGWAHGRYVGERAT